MKRWVGTLTFILATAITSLALGQEIQLTGPLAGAPSCRRCVQYRSGRLTISPTVGITLQDDFDRAIFVGGALNFHINEVIAIGVWGAGAVGHLSTSLTNNITTTLTPTGGMGNTDPMASPNIPQGHNFPQQIGQLNWMLSAPQLTIVPLRGKLALFQNIFVDTDFYLFGGLGIIGLTERAEFDSSAAGANAMTNQTARASRIAFTGTFGAGLNFYINSIISLSFEYRAFPFNWNNMGTDENSAANTCGPGMNQSCQGFPDHAVPADPNNVHAGGRYVIDAGDRQFHFNQMINFSINIFLPPKSADRLRAP